MKAMGRFAFGCIVLAHTALSVAHTQSPTEVQACRAAEVTLATATPTVKAGTRPQFSVVVANKGDRWIRVLDVRNGRRIDLQDAYFELFIVEGEQVVDLPSVISDPGPLADTDYTVLKPGERIEVKPLSYTKAAERLPPGKYSAFILFWQNPEGPHRSRCRSSEAPFVVSMKPSGRPHPTAAPWERERHKGAEAVSPPRLSTRRRFSRADGQASRSVAAGSSVRARRAGR